MENYLDQNEIKKLAVDLDNFSYDYDPYVYNDNVENKEEQVEKIIESIMNHDIEGFKEWLTTVTEESAIDSEVRSAYSLLSRLENAEKNFTIEMQLHDAKLEVQKEFPKETELKEKNERLFELNALLNIDESNHMIIEEEQIEEEQEITEQTTQTTRKEYVPKFGTR